MADLFSVSEMAEILEMNPKTLKAYINWWGDEFPDATLYDQGGRGRRTRFYDVRALAKVARFVALYPCAPPIQLPANAMPATGTRILTPAGVRRILGVSNTTVMSWMERGLIKPPLFATTNSTYWRYDELLEAVNDILNQRIPTSSHPEGSPFVPHTGRAGAGRPKKTHRFKVVK